MPSAELQSVLSVNNRPFINGMNEAVAKGKKSGKEIESSFAGISSKLAGMFTIGAVVAAGRAILNYSSDVQDAADKLNLTTDAVQGLNGAFIQSGATAEVVSKGIIKLNESIDAAREGSTDARGRFAALGISMEDIRKKSPEQILLMIADAVKNSIDPVKTLASVMDVLGKSGSKMLPGLKNGAEGLKAMMAEIDKLSPEDIAKIDEAGDAIERLGIRAKVAGSKMALNMQKVFEPLVIPGGLEDLTNQFNKNYKGPTNLDPKARSTVTGGGRGRGYASPDMYESEMATLALEADAREKMAKEAEKDAKELADFIDGDLKHRQDMHAEIQRINEDTWEVEQETAKIGMTSSELIVQLEKERVGWLEKAKQYEEDIFGLHNKDAALARQRAAELAQKISAVDRDIQAQTFTNSPRGRKLTPEEDAEIDRNLRFGAFKNFGKGSLTSGGLTSGRLSSGGLGTGSGNAYHAVRAGDAARAKAALKNETTDDPVIDNTAALVELWGGKGRRK